VDMCFAGRAFLYPVAALGQAGGGHAAAAFLEEVRGTFAQGGARSVAEAQAASVLHPGAVWPDMPGNAGGMDAPRPAPRA